MKYENFHQFLEKYMDSLFLSSSLKVTNVIGLEVILNNIFVIVVNIHVNIWWLWDLDTRTCINPWRSFSSISLSPFASTNKTQITCSTTYCMNYTPPLSCPHSLCLTATIFNTIVHELIKVKHCNHSSWKSRVITGDGAILFWNLLQKSYDVCSTMYDIYGIIIRTMKFNGVLSTNILDKWIFNKILLQLTTKLNDTQT